MKVVEVGQENQDVIVLLHGGGLSWWQYQSQMELLCKNYHVVVPILDGHAGSNADFVSIEASAKQLLAYIGKEYGGSVLLIAGLSLGGQILLEMLALRKDIYHAIHDKKHKQIDRKFGRSAIFDEFSFD